MSMWILLLAAVCAAGILLVGAVLVTVFLIRALGGRGGEADADEARRIQEFHRRLRGMEERIESLEAILIDADTERKGVTR